CAARWGLARGESGSQQPEPVLIDARAVRCMRVAQVRESSTGVATALSGAAAAAGQAPVLSVREMSAGYGRRPALTRIDLDVPAESCVALVREARSGETT